ncbi:MAG: hypothetical protein KC492_27790, partial [Myxococcales bacterium]|nr:hypothetical protein [Myxococcales bacterium]
LATPTGFTTPAQRNSRTVTVVAPSISVGSRSIGKDLQSSGSGSLDAPAPPGNLTVTLSSADPNKLLLSNTAGGTGAASIQVVVNAGSTQLPNFYLFALDRSGNVELSATANGFDTGRAPITLYPSGFVFYSSSASNFNTTTLSPNTSRTIGAARLNETTSSYAQLQGLRGGLQVSVPISSSDPSVGTLTVNPVVFNGGDSTVNTEFAPQSPGATTLDIGVPTGFDMPSNRTQITATVQSPPINTNNFQVGKNLQTGVSWNLGAPAPPGNLDVQISSADPGKLLLSDDPGQIGSGSITVTVPAGSSQIPQFFAQSLSDMGTVLLTVSATDFETNTS